MARDYVKQRADVQNLKAEVESLTAAQGGFFSSLTTSGEKYSQLVDIARQHSEVLSTSNKSSKENNKLAQNQTKAARILVSFGRKRSIFSKIITKQKLKQLKAARQQQDFEDDITDSMIEQAEAQEDGLQTAGKMNAAIGVADGLFSGIGSKIQEAITNPMTAVVGVVTKYSELTDKIGATYGGLGGRTSELRANIGQTAIETLKWGYTTDDILTSMRQLNSEFAISAEEANELQISIADLSKSTGASVQEASKLVGYFTETTDMSKEQTVELLKQTEALAKQNDVAPGVVLSDIAESTEIFAKFGGIGTKNLLRAAVQARKLGMSLGQVASTAEGLLDFQSSLNNEIEASIMLGRDVNLSKARELALSGDMEGLQREIVKIVGSEADFNRMNVLQRQSLAKAVGMNVTDLQKIVSAEKEQASLTGSLAEQGDILEKIMPLESMSALTESWNNIQSNAMKIAEETGPEMEKTLEPILQQVNNMVTGAADMVLKLTDAIGVGNILKGVLALVAGKFIIGAISAIYSGLAALGPFGVAGAIAATAFLMSRVRANEAAVAGDLMSPADGKTMISTKEGGLFELSPNDDVMAAPGLLDNNTNTVTANPTNIGGVEPQLNKLIASVNNQSKSTTNVSEQKKIFSDALTPLFRELRTAISENTQVNKDMKDVQEDNPRKVSDKIIDGLAFSRY
tara:strand:+ start:1348 stop:3408 length:2061 start_codon:yes stop_codon:yes gene_type:complete